MACGFGRVVGCALRCRNARRGPRIFLVWLGEPCRRVDVNILMYLPFSTAMIAQLATGLAGGAGLGIEPRLAALAHPFRTQRPLQAQLPIARSLRLRGAETSIPLLQRAGMALPTGPTKCGGPAGRCGNAARTLQRAPKMRAETPRQEQISRPDMTRFTQ